jgi:hypothetical protein
MLGGNPIGLVSHVAVAAGSLLIGAGEVANQAGGGVGRWIEGLAEDDSFVSTPGGEEGQEAECSAEAHGDRLYLPHVWLHFQQSIPTNCSSIRSFAQVPPVRYAASRMSASGVFPMRLNSDHRTRNFIGEILSCRLKTFFIL